MFTHYVLQKTLKRSDKQEISLLFGQSGKSSSVHQFPRCDPPSNGDGPLSKILYKPNLSINIKIKEYLGVSNFFLSNSQTKY